MVPTLYWVVLLFICTQVAIFIYHHTIWSLQHENNISKEVRNDVSVRYNHSQPKALPLVETPGSTAPQPLTILPEVVSVDEEPASQGRVALLVSYVGVGLPAWFDTFLLTASFSAPTVDWLVFITDSPLRPTPENVRLITLTKQDLYSRIARLDVYSSTHFEEMLRDVTDLFEQQPYVFVEMKPCLGVLFQDYLTGYSHWGYADVDQLLGRMDVLIPMHLLNRFDIYTSSFGDNFRMYMRGQLTIHRNDPFINNIWRNCEQLDQLHLRLRHFRESGRRHWQFSSAEGCYSRVVANQKNISVYIGATQLTDAYSAPVRDRESLVLGRNLMRCYEYPLDLNSSRGSGFAGPPELEQRPAPAPLSFLDYRCSYWVAPEYQVCLDSLPAHADIVSINRSMHYFPEDLYLHGEGCRQAAIGHFQGWKGVFYHFTTKRPPPDSNVLLITDTGFIPLKIGSKSDISAPEEFGDKHLGRLTRSPKAEISYQLKTLGPESATSYCLEFSKSLKKCTRPVKFREISWFESKRAEVLAGVTLIVVDWLDEFLSERRSWKGRYVNSNWKSPIVFALAKRYYLKPSLEAAMRRRLSKEAGISMILVDLTDAEASVSFDVTNSNEKDDSCLKAFVLPDKMLFNMALDVASTDLVLILPFGASLHCENASCSVEEVLLREHGDLDDSVGLIIPSTEEDVDGEMLSNFSPNAPLPGVPVELRGKPVSFHVQDFTKYNSQMAPMFFNRSSSPHGSGFIRFSEELNGCGCFGSYIVRSLYGAGYSLVWSEEIQAAMRNDRVELENLPNFGNISACGCLSEGLDSLEARRNSSLNVFNNSALSDNPESSVNKMVQRFNKYFSRAVRFRRSGVSDIYARQPFGKNFEEEQRDLIAEKSGGTGK